MTMMAHQCSKPKVKNAFQLLFVKTQQPAMGCVWHQILYIYLCFQCRNPIPKGKVIIIIKFYEKISTY